MRIPVPVVELTEMAKASGRVPKKPRGRRAEKEENKSYYKIGAAVEKDIPMDRKQDRHSIVAARRSVSDKTRLGFDLVAQYHKKYRHFCAQTGIKIPA